MQCDSCGSEATDLASVQRIYLVQGRGDDAVEATGTGSPDRPVTDPTAERQTVLDDIEQWCFPCRTLYPHRLVVEGGLDPD